MSDTLPEQPTADGPDEARGIDFVRETARHMAEREALAAPAPVVVSSQRDVAVVINGFVSEVRLAFHGAASGETIVDLGDFEGLTEGQALPWPRAKRDRLLAASDWTQTLDQMSRPQEWRDAWAAYREALRELPITSPDPCNVVWPSIPT